MDAAYSAKSLMGHFIVVHDPDPDGGLVAGAELTGLFLSLRLGVLTPGTEIIYNRRRWRVVGQVGQPQTLADARHWTRML